MEEFNKLAENYNIAERFKDVVVSDVPEVDYQPEAEEQGNETGIQEETVAQNEPVTQPIPENTQTVAPVIQTNGAPEFGQVAPQTTSEVTPAI